MWLVTTAISTWSMTHIDEIFGRGWAWQAKPGIEVVLGIIGFLMSRHWIYKRYARCRLMGTASAANFDRDPSPEKVGGEEASLRTIGLHAIESLPAVLAGPRGGGGRGVG